MKMWLAREREKDCRAELSDYVLCSTKPRRESYRYGGERVFWSEGRAATIAPHDIALFVKGVILAPGEGPIEVEVSIKKI